MRYLIHARVSTDKQDTETQIRLIKERLDSLHPNGDYTYVIFDEADTSSTIKYTKRPILQEMLNTIRKDDTVVVYLFDRLARDIIEMVTIYRIITKEKGAKILSLKDAYTDEFSVGLMGIIAQKVRDELKVKTKDTLATKKKKGERYSRHLPYGFTLHDTHMVPIRVGNEIVYKKGVLIPLEEEQLIIKRIDELSQSGYGYQKIANVLAEEGKMSRAGKKFPKMSICRILERLKNPSEVALSHKMIGTHAYSQ